VLATLHLLFSNSARGHAFGVYGIARGLAGAAGFALGGILVSLDHAGVGWRAVSFVNVFFFFFFFANLSFYLVMRCPRSRPDSSSCRWRSPSLPRPASAGVRAKHRGTLVLIEGCAIQIAPCRARAGNRIHAGAFGAEARVDPDDLRF
jgi:MFS family permease